MNATETINRVSFQESIPESINRIPFLKRFLINDGLTYGLSYRKILEYLGDDQHQIGDFITSETMNKVLEIAEARGDL